MRTSLALAALFTLTLPVEAAAHDWNREWRSIRVDASAFDLAEPAGRYELAKRIARAVNRICGSDPACRDEAWASTEEQVGWAIERDIRLHVLADERAAQLRACEWDTCLPPPEPGRYEAPPLPPEPSYDAPSPEPSYYAPPRPARRGATVTRVVIRVVQGGAPATILTYCR